MQTDVSVLHEVDAAADKIEVRWPAGTVQTLAGPIAGNRLLEIVEAPARAATAGSPRN